MLVYLSHNFRQLDLYVLHVLAIKIVHYVFFWLC